MKKPSSASTSEPATEQIPAIFPDEIIIEILTWLPIKPILRFRCVSKSWLSFISSPLFIKTHLPKSVAKNDYDRHRLLFHTMELSEGFFKFKFKQCDLSPVLCNAPTVEAINVFDSLGCNRDVELVITDFRMVYFHNVKIVGSSNGLICVTVSGDVLLWNPSIRKFKKLPDFGPKPDGDGYFYVLGYDESDDDYKVLGISSGRDGDSDPIELRCIDLYSRNADVWRRIEGFNGGIWDHGFCFLNGKLHWSTCPRFGQGGKIVSLDLVNETYGEVEQPKYGEGTFDWTLEVLGGCLSIFCYYRSNRVEVWIMKDYGVKESWTKVVLVPNFSDPRYECCCTPVFQSKDGEILFWYTPNLPGLTLYNPKSNSLMHPHITKLEALMEVKMYVESLVLLDDHDGGERRRP